MFGELSRKYSAHINNLVESVERVSYALFVHEPGHAGHLYGQAIYGYAIYGKATAAMASVPCLRNKT